MAKKEIAVDGMTLEFVNPSDSGSLSIVTSPSTKGKAENKEIYKGNVTVSVSGFENSSVSAGSGAGVLIPTTIKTKLENEFVLREEDTGTLTGTGTNKTPPPATLPFSTSIKISDAGQSKVLSE